MKPLLRGRTAGREAQLETYGDGLKMMFLKHASGLNGLLCLGWVDIIRFQHVSRNLKRAKF